MIYVQIAGFIIALSTFIFLILKYHITKKKLKLEYNQAILVDYKIKKMITYSILRITNNSTKDVYIRTIGFTTKKAKIPVGLVDNEIISEVMIREAETFLKSGSIEASENLPEDIDCSSIFTKENSVVKSGITLLAWFNFRDLKKHVLASSKEKIYAYCIDQTNRKSKIKINRKMILCSNEPVQ